MSGTRGWSAGTNRRFGLMLALATVTCLVLTQRLAVHAGVAPEASWRPALAATVLVLAAAGIGYPLSGRRRRYAPVPAHLRPELARLTARAGLVRQPEIVMDPRALATG